MPFRFASARMAGVAVVLAAALIGGSRETQNAVASGGTRELTILHTHTREQETITFRRNGSYDSAGLQKLNWLLRDWRQDEPTKMDPALFDLMWEVYRESGSREPIVVVSAYRSPGTNAMLRRRSRGVAKHSQHVNGQALDFHLPDVGIARVRDIAMRMQAGGVGFYPNARNPWVHLDTGGVRYWPRMSRDHLARLFPDGKTVFIPADGKPMAGFELARAEIEATGRSVASGSIAVAEGRVTGRSLFAILFGGGEDDEEPVARRGRGRGGNTVVASVLPTTNDESSPTSFLLRQQASQQPISASRARPLPRPEPAVPAAEPATPAPVLVAAAPAVPQTAATQVPAPQASAPQASGPQASGPQLAAVPLPPVRPAGLQSATPAPEAPKAVEDEPLKVAAVPLPPRRPRDLADILRVANVPVPPQRPGDVGVLAIATGQETAPRNPVIASIGGTPAGDLPSAILQGPQASRPSPPPVLAYATEDAPAQTGRSAVVAAVPLQSPAPVQPAKAVEVALPTIPPAERLKMRTLMSQIAAATAPVPSATRVEAPSVTGSVNAPVVAGHFAQLSTERLEAGRFTGSAIRPVRARLLGEN